MKKLWGVIVVGMMLGLAGGLIYTWFVSPLTYIDTYPPMLAARHRQDWARMTVWAYAIEGNWERTQVRLLNFPQPVVASVAEQVLDRAVVQGQPIEVLQSIAQLAADYGATGPGVAVYLEPAGTLSFDAMLVASATPVATLIPTRTPLHATPTLAATAVRPRSPTRTPTPLPMLDPPFRIVSQTLTCDLAPSIAISLEVSRTIVVRRREVQEQVGLPMREVWLIWESGADRAITGFRPDKGLGYADFDVEPGRTYNIYIDSPTGPPVLTVQVEPCAPREGEGWVSRQLVLWEEVEPEEEAATTVTPTLTPVLRPTSTPAPVE